MAIETDPRWTAVLTHDAASDGKFYYAVRTTGVYCRPSCAARRALPENVSFHSTPAAAERAGFRPCRRCHPDQPGSRHASKVVAACRALRASPATPLRHLASEAGLSPFHFQRLFKAATGLTPKQYALTWRADRLRAALPAADSVTDAAYAAGFNSSSRFYATADAALGMAPARFRAGGHGVEIRFAVGSCSLGSILAAQSERGICAILLGDDPRQLEQELRRCFPGARLRAAGPEFAATLAQVVAWVEAPGRDLDLPLDIRGTAFQQRVWKALRQIPAGAAASYADIARRIGAPNSARAVAGACAANRIAVAIPCHRVVRSDGDISGYRWGTDRKRVLLQREKDA